MRRRWRGHAIGALLVPLFATTLLAAGCGDSTSRERPPTPTWTPPATPGVHDLPRSGLALRQLGVVAWSGSRLVVWGGRVPANDSEPTRALVDGAVFDPSTGRWRKMAPPPFEMPLVDPHGARLGNDILVAGSLCDAQIPPPTEGSPHCPSGPAAALYDPLRNRWTAVSTPPVPPMSAALNGSERAGFVVDWAGRQAPAAIVYERATDTWTSLDVPEPVPATATDVSASICVHADGSGAEMLYLDPTGPAYTSPLVNIRRWRLDVATAPAWSGPQLISGLEIGGTPLLSLVCPTAARAFVTWAVGFPAQGYSELRVVDADGAASTIEGTALPLAVDLRTWGDATIAFPMMLSPDEDTSLSALTASGSWVSVSSAMDPLRGLYYPSGSVWTGDRIYYADAVWIPPPQLLSS